MKKLFFSVILSAMAIICLVVGVSCKHKNAKTSLYSDYEESVASGEISAIESEKPSETAGTTESVKANDEASVSESVTSEESATTPESGKFSETSESTETTEATEATELSESPESTVIFESPETGEGTKPSESTDTTETPELPESSDNGSESVSESNSESIVESNSESVVESNSESIVESVSESIVESVSESISESNSESVFESISESNSESNSESVVESNSESVESSSSGGTDGETVSESQSESTSETQTDTEPETKDSCGDSSESGEGETDYDELSDSGDSSEGGKAVEDAKTVLDIVSGAVEELAIKADEAEFTAEFFSILKDKGYTHFKFKAEGDGVDDYALSGNKYPSDNGVAEIRVEAYKFFDKSVCLRSGGATYIRIYDFVFFSSEETENLTFGDNGYLCCEDEGLVYADYGNGNDYGFRFPDKYFEFEKGLLNADNEIIGNAAVTYKTEDGCPCKFRYGSYDDNGKLIGFNDASGLVSDTSIYINCKKLSEKYVAIRPEVRSPIVFNKCELVYSGELSVARCRPDKKGGVINVAYNSDETGTFYLSLKNAKKVKIIVETEKGKNILLFSDNGASCYMDETNGKYEKIITLPKTGVIKIDIEKCKDFCLRYQIIS